MATRSRTEDELKKYIFDNSHQEPNTGCWLWSGHEQPNGYGVISFNNKQVRTHRLSYLLYNGPILPGKIVMHKCDTPQCVNPDHLKSGTQAENLKDMKQKGRNRNQFMHIKICKNGHELTGENVKYRPSRRNP